MNGEVEIVDFPVYAERTMSPHQFNEELACRGSLPTAISFESEGKQQHICVNIE